ncbi:hypothetical protein [Streptomyces alanosinicus]|uniref:Uncharacterized protein n=1 Tax=Streptomyces alanosinicus TaxID=68171 RepID=A0A918YMY3_9ACTN|nr:hypothetical protein [Streptomyces alanosinicus]GHE09223.1 hypothetical protein GCM10010339_60770 [Streptomyces alanosinicus]
MTSTDTMAPDTVDTNGVEAEADEEAQATILSEIDLYLLSKPIAEALGDGWREDPEDTPAGFADKSIRLIHPDGRSIGVRHLWQGKAVQTFAIGGPAPKRSAGPERENRLPKGIRYSKGVCFTTHSPLQEILTVIRTSLLPAFDGHRPRLRADGTPIPPAVEAPTEQSQNATAGTAEPAQNADTAPPTTKSNAKSTGRVKGTGHRTASAKRTTKRRTTPVTA